MSKLPQQPSAARAHGGADDEFLFAARHPRQDQVGDIGAGDQQHEGGRPQQDQQHGPRLLGQIFAERVTRCAVKPSRSGYDFG